MRPEPWLGAQALGQPGVPRQYVALQLRLPGNAREIAGQPGAFVQPCLDRRDRIVGADQIIARDQQMGAALGRMVAGGGTVQLCECPPGFAGLGDIGQQRPRHRVAVQVIAHADGVQFKVHSPCSTAVRPSAAGSTCTTGTPAAARWAMKWCSSSRHVALRTLW